MDVWIVVGSWNYEGNDYPEAIFTNEKKANKFVGVVRGNRSFDDVRVVKYTLNEKPTYEQEA